MNGPDVTETTSQPARRACLVDGCPCKDARIVSPRRASYFASVARSRGETADRVVAVDPSWSIPARPDREPAEELGAFLSLDLPLDLDAAA